MNEVLIRNVVFWTAVVLSMICVAFPPFRYLFFSVPFLVLFATLGDGSVRLGDEAKPFLAFVAAGVLMAPIATGEGLKDLLLTFAGVSVSLLCEAPTLRAKKLFLFSLMSAAIYFPIFGDLHDLTFNLLKSQSPFESNFGFVFGAVALIAMLEQRKRLALTCLVLSVVCLKRIAVLGLLACFVMWLAGEENGRKILNPIVMLCINCALLGAMLLYGAGYFDFAVHELTGQSANEFGQGRQALLSLPANAFFRHPEQFFLFGAGPGATYELANKGVMQYVGKANLHSDLIKIFYEYGFVFYCIFIGLMYSAKKYATRIAFLFMNVLFITDNTLIYYFLLLVFVVGVRSVNQQDEKNSNSKPGLATQRQTPAMGSVQ